MSNSNFLLTLGEIQRFDSLGVKTALEEYKRKQKLTKCLGLEANVFRNEGIGPETKVGGKPLSRWISMQEKRSRALKIAGAVGIGTLALGGTALIVSQFDNFDQNDEGGTAEIMKADTPKAPKATVDPEIAGKIEVTQEQLILNKNNLIIELNTKYQQAELVIKKLTNDLNGAEKRAAALKQKYSPEEDRQEILKLIEEKTEQKNKFEKDLLKQKYDGQEQFNIALLEKERLINVESQEIVKLKISERNRLTRLTALFKEQNQKLLNLQDELLTKNNSNGNTQLDGLVSELQTENMRLNTNIVQGNSELGQKNERIGTLEANLQQATVELNNRDERIGNLITKGNVLTENFNQASAELVQLRTIAARYDLQIEEAKKEFAVQLDEQLNKKLKENKRKEDIRCNSRVRNEIAQYKKECDLSSKQTNQALRKERSYLKKQLKQFKK